MIEFRTTVRSRGPQGVVGKCFSSLFFLVFASFGLVFIWLIARDAVADIRTRSWSKTNCEIISSSVGDTDPQGRHTGDFYFDVRYRYSFGGLDFTSDRAFRAPQAFSDYAKASRLVARFAPESSAFCYVNPAAPGEAILEPKAPWVLLVIFFPAIFVLIGAGGIYFTWRPQSAVAQPISDRASPAKAQSGLIIFFSIFLLMGSAAFGGFFLLPAFHIIFARGWPAVPCSIISSEVKTERGGRNTTYKVNILYSYEIDGHSFEANRYSFMTGSSSGRGAKQQTVRQHPPGSQTVCYVNPSDPTDAVLYRGFTADMFFGLIPLVFVAVGAGGIIFTIRAGRKNMLAAGGAIASISSHGSKSSAIMNLPIKPDGTVLLKPRISPVAKLFGILAVALFWNGIVSVFVREAFGGWRSSNIEWFLVIFLIPFVLVGLGLLIAVGYFFLALFNPRPQLRVTPGAVPLGGTLRLQWEIAGRVGVLQRLHIRVEGREEATYRRGTNTAVDKSKFANLEIASLTNPQDLRNGARTVTLPAGAMHSFSAKNNKIIWCVQVHGVITRWPDVREEFPLTVTPAARTTPQIA